MNRVVTVLCLILALPAAAQSTPPAQNESGSVLKEVADIVFEAAEKRAIEEFYDRFPSANPSEKDDDKNNGVTKGGKTDKQKGKQKYGRGNGLPPGLAKRDQLPPGLAKRGNHLPPGLMKGDLPPELETRLPKLPENVERVIVDNDVLLVEKSTDLILDVLEGVIKGK